MSKITKVFVGLGAIASLGVAFLPMSSYAANPENVTVNITIAPALSGEAVCATVGNTGMTAGTTATANCTASYSANGPASMTIKDQNTNTNLVGTTVNTRTIAALSTAANLTDISGAAGAAWGYKFVVTTAGAGSGGLVAANANVGRYNGVSTTAVKVGSNTGAVSGAVGTFTFGVKTMANTPADTYSDVVVVAITAGA